MMGKRTRRILWGALLLSASAPALTEGASLLTAILYGCNKIVVTHSSLFNEWYVEWILCFIWAIVIIVEATKYLFGGEDDEKKLSNTAPRRG